jgi:hypothetical protein
MDKPNNKKNLCATVSHLYTEYIMLGSLLVKIKARREVILHTHEIQMPHVVYVSVAIVFQVIHA